MHVVDPRHQLVARAPRPAALTFSVTCSGRLAPTIAEETLGFCSTHATASWARVRPTSSAIGLQPLHPLEDVVAQPAADHVGAALVVGGARALRRLLARLVLAGQRTLGDRRPDDLADAELLAGRDHLLLDDPPEHVVLRLVGDQRDVQLAGQGVRPAGSPRPATRRRRCRAPCRSARRRRRPPSSPRAGSRSRSGAPGRGRRSRCRAGAASRRSTSMMCLRDRPWSFGPTGAGRPEDLGEDLQPVAALARQRLAEHALGQRVGVHVGGVERRDALVERLPHAGERGVLLDLADPWVSQLP